MARIVAWAFAALLLVPAAGSSAELCEKGQQPPAKTASGAQDGKPDQKRQGPTLWWIEPRLRKELGITDQQSAAIDAIWKKGLPQRTETWQRLHKLEDSLDQMMLDASADEATIVAHIDKLEAARTEASKARTLMLYRINKVLTPEQRAKMAAKAKEMREQRDNNGRKN